MTRHTIDHFTRPIQSDRMRHDYGHTQLDREPVPMPVFWRFIGGVAVMAGLAVAVTLLCAVVP